MGEECFDESNMDGCVDKNSSTEWTMNEYSLIGWNLPACLHGLDWPGCRRRESVLILTIMISKEPAGWLLFSVLHLPLNPLQVHLSSVPLFFQSHHRVFKDPHHYLNIILRDKNDGFQIKCQLTHWTDQTSWKAFVEDDLIYSAINKGSISLLIIPVVWIEAGSCIMSDKRAFLVSQMCWTWKSMKPVMMWHKEQTNLQNISSAFIWRIECIDFSLISQVHKFLGGSGAMSSVPQLCSYIGALSSDI